MSHTPGTWLVDGNLVYALDETGRANRFSARVEGGYTYGGCRLKENNSKTDDNEIQANISLIASAPDLLEALKELLELTDDPSNDADPEESVFAFARSVIAKAQGEE